MNHLSLLPLDILRRIPDCYRTWQLLRIASRAIHRRLGDYHQYCDIICECDSKPLEYSSFISGSVRHMVDCNSHTLAYYMFGCNGANLAFAYISNLITFYDEGHREIFDVRRTGYTIYSIDIYEIVVVDEYSLKDALWTLYNDLPEIYTAIVIGLRDREGNIEVLNTSIRYRVGASPMRSIVSIVSDSERIQLLTSLRPDDIGFWSDASLPPPGARVQRMLYDGAKESYVRAVVK